MIDVVMVTNTQRPKLYQQSLNSLYKNASNKEAINLTVVYDGAHGISVDEHAVTVEPIYTVNMIFPANNPVGASRCRNIGASSVPKYRRGQYVMFVDDDVYMCPGWDKTLMDNRWSDSIVSGHAHPYNHTTLKDLGKAIQTNVLSTVHLFMEWKTWDETGYFTEPGGPGGSEDVDYCNRATRLHYDLIVTKPHCLIHAGMTNSKGERIVGYLQVAERNRTIESQYGLQGKVIYS